MRQFWAGSSKLLSQQAASWQHGIQAGFPVQCAATCDLLFPLHELRGYVCAMSQEATLSQRLNVLFSTPGRTVTLRDLLHAVPDLDERKTWRFCFALCRMMSLLNKDTEEYKEGLTYYWDYVQNGRCSPFC